MATVTSGETLLTIEEFLKLSLREGPRELVRGKVLKHDFTYPWHGYVSGKVGRIFGEFIDRNSLGTPFSKTGILIARDPDTLRGADFLYYSYQRLPKGTIPKKGYIETAPDLAAEVRSHDQPWKDLLAKVAEYLNAGVLVVLVFDPQRSTVTVYEPDQPERTLGREETLTVAEILPGFATLVGKFFE